MFFQKSLTSPKRIKAKPERLRSCGWLYLDISKARSVVCLLAVLGPLERLAEKHIIRDGARKKKRKKGDVCHSNGSRRKHTLNQRAFGWGWGGHSAQTGCKRRGKTTNTKKNFPIQSLRGSAGFPSGPQCCSPGCPDRDIIKTGEHRDQDKIETFRIQDQDQTKSVYISKKSHGKTQQMSFYIYVYILQFLSARYISVIFLSHFAALTATVIPRYISTFKD